MSELTIGGKFLNHALSSVLLGKTLLKPQSVWRAYLFRFLKRYGVVKVTKFILCLALMNLNNTKIRDGKMDVKSYVQTVDGLEQWDPKLKAEFPISKVQFRTRNLPCVHGWSNLH